MLSKKQTEAKLLELYNEVCADETDGSSESSADEDDDWSPDWMLTGNKEPGAKPKQRTEFLEIDSDHEHEFDAEVLSGGSQYAPRLSVVIPEILQPESPLSIPLSSPLPSTSAPLSTPLSSPSPSTSAGHSSNMPSTSAGQPSACSTPRVSSRQSRQSRQPIMSSPDIVVDGFVGNLACRMISLYIKEPQLN